MPCMVEFSFGRTIFEELHKVSRVQTCFEMLCMDVKISRIIHLNRDCGTVVVPGLFKSSVYLES